MIVNKLYFSTAPFYRITNDSQSAQTPCYAVVDDISQYSSTEFDKVYNKATDSWYMKNNLNQYEEYGIYDTTTGGTYYEGKLAIVDGYEYEYENGSWNNVGEISGSTYPVYYEELDAPVDNLQFISLRSANAYQCPYYGLNADISTEPYIYTISNNWLPKYDWVVMPNDYYCRQGDKYEKLEYSERQGDNTFIGLGEYEFGELIETGSEDCSSLVPSDYIELEYFTVPYISYATRVFNIKCKNNAAYDYTIDFMPLNWETNSYYKHLLGGNDEGTNFGKVYIYPLDNGWGSIYNRTIASLANYNLTTRSGNPLSGQYGFHDNVKASVTLCYNEHILNNGAKIKVENEGYPEYIGTSTSTTGSSVAYDTEYDIPLFTRASTDTNGATYLPYMRFYKFQVYDTVNETDAYHYVPVKRVSDNKVGLFDIANQIFYAPTAFDFEAGPEK